MDSADFLEIARSILSQPTAPFREAAVRAEIERLLARCPHVACRRDDFGNLIATYQRGAAPLRFAFAAHMDHPGYVWGAKSGEEARRHFLGGVPERYREKQPPTCEFDGFAMWDLPACDVREGRIFSRACDDLIGCAAIVAMFHELERRGAETSVCGLFTRGEEVGFVGAMKLAAARPLPGDVVIVSLECSSEKGGPVKMGDGVIIRTGDKTSIFDSRATAQLLTLAKERGLAHQRALMQGGTCEATAYALEGYTTAAICVALGNYHNCGADDRIEPEFVSVDDAVAMTMLCVEAAAAAELPDPFTALRSRIDREIAELEPFFPEPGEPG